MKKKIMGILGVILFISPNLNIPESLLYYCGVESHETAMIISVALFAIVDLLAGIILLSSSPTKKMILVLLAFNLIYIIPVAVNMNLKEILQYILFITPVTIVAIMISRDEEIRTAFMKYLKYAAVILFIAAVAYIILMYVGTNRDQYGMISIENMTYGDIAYLFLTGFAICAIDCMQNRSVFGYLGMFVFTAAIVFSGARSAILCVICVVVVLWTIELIAKAEKNKKITLSVITVITALSVALSMFILPDTSRFKVNNIDANADDFSAESIIFEARAQGLGDLDVIYVPTNEVRKLSSIFEEAIVNNDCTRRETETALRDDVKNNTNQYIKLINEETDRKIAERYTARLYRTFLWRTAFKEFKKHPLIGNGPCYYKNKYNGYFPHNVFLESMTDFGIVGLIVISFLGIYCFVNGIRYYLKSRDDNVLNLIVLLFSHFPRYVLYTTIYSNATLAMTVILFITIGKLGENERTNKAVTDKI